MAHPIWHGVTVCPCIVASAPLVERRFREAGLIVQGFGGLVSQGCYSAGAVAASAGTHDGGGVLDLKDWSPYRADIDALFTDCGWLDFYRPYGALYARSPAHHHIVLNGCPHLSQAAADQVTAAKAGLNGLAGKGKDDGPRPLKTWQQALADDAGTVPTQPVPPEEEDMITPEIVASLYRSMTGADAPQSDIDWQVDNAIRRDLTAKDVRTLIGTTVAARTHAVKVGYSSMLLREATPSEVTAQLAIGHPYDQIFIDLSQSREYKQKHGA